MSVKTIFKVLIGTIVCIVVSSLLIEVFNVSVSSMHIKQTCKIAAQQSADLFTQETYKELTDDDSKLAGTTAVDNINDKDGNLYISGNFYEDLGTTPEDIWDKLYKDDDSTFKDFFEQDINSPGITKQDDKENIVRYNLKDVSSKIKSDVSKDSLTSNVSSSINAKFRNINRLYNGIVNEELVKSKESEYENPTGATTEEEKEKIRWQWFRDGDPIVDHYSAAVASETMTDQLNTPVNLGFPYFDPVVVNKMFRWDLAKILSNGKSDIITQDTDNDGNPIGETYVKYNGFKCYVSRAQITDFDYYIYDKEQDADKIKNKINIDASNLTTINDNTDTSVTGTAETGKKNNNYIVIVGIKYTIPVRYEGITPLKRICEYSWNQQVNGATGNRYNSVHGDNSYAGTNKTLNTDAQDNLTNNLKIQNPDGTEVDNGVLSSTGELYYTLVR